MKQAKEGKIPNKQSVSIPCLEFKQQFLVYELTTNQWDMQTKIHFPLFFTDKETEYQIGKIWKKPLNLGVSASSFLK